MPLECLVGEHTGRTYFREVPAENVLQNSVFMAAEIYIALRCKGPQVPPSRMVAVEPYTPVTMDAPVHLVVEERPYMLVSVGPLFEAVSTVNMSCHQRHILKMAFASFIAYRAVMGMVEHEHLDDARPERLYFLIIDRNAHAVLHRRHAGHDDLSAGVFFIPELLYRAEPAGTDGIHGGVPAEVGDVEAQVQACMKEVVPFFHLVRFIFNVNMCQFLSPVTPFMDHMLFEILPEIFQRALKRVGSSGREDAERMSHSHHVA